jgi:hypothetical protein
MQIDSSHMQAQTWVDIPGQDLFSREKLATWLRHRHGRKSEDIFSCNYTKASFVVKYVVGYLSIGFFLKLFAQFFYQHLMFP